MGRTKKYQNNLSPLTIEDIPSLIGKKIEIEYFGLNGIEHDEIVVGSLVSRYDLAKTEVMDLGITRAEMWDKNMTPKQLETAKNTLCILDNTGTETFVHSVKNGTFVTSDHRQVFYGVIE